MQQLQNGDQKLRNGPFQRHFQIASHNATYDEGGIGTES